jgi:GT2 family glycosyltransferase
MTAPRPRRNDWSAIRPPEIGAWRPALTVSVVVPAYRRQDHLDLTLAALSRQTYPADLLEVVVVDDSSPQPLRLPEIRPANTEITRVESGWGPGNAVHIGVSRSAGEIVHRLDADMVPHSQHVEALARWHHAVPYAVTLGHKLFVDVSPGDADWPSPERVAAGPVGDLFDPATAEPHDYLERMFRTTDDLRRADHTAFMAHVGASAAVRRELYDLAGGYDPAMHLGEDTEFGYRLAQAGALFIPEHAARSWHLGRTAMMRDTQQLRRHNRPFLADRMAYPRWLRRSGGTAWTVPLVVAVVEVGAQPLETVRACVDGLLHGDEKDLRVVLVGPWDRLGDERRAVLEDAMLEARLIAATYRGEPRVLFATEAPQSAFPSPFLLKVPADRRLTPTTLAAMIAAADRDGTGVVRAGGDVELWRTAALARASIADDDVGAVIRECYGEAIVNGRVTDLRQMPAAALADLSGGATVDHRAVRFTPASVEVAGVRSLARAAAVVARMTARRWAARLPGERRGKPRG